MSDPDKLKSKDFPTLDYAHLEQDRTVSNPFKVLGGIIALGMAVLGVAFLIVFGLGAIYALNHSNHWNIKDDLLECTLGVVIGALLLIFGVRWLVIAFRTRYR